MPSIKVVTLNIGRGFPKCGIEKAFEFLSNDEWDIACIQDMWETDTEDLMELFPTAQIFAPMAKHPRGCTMVPVGIGIFSRNLPLKSTSVYAYVGNVSPVLDLNGVEVDAFNNAYPKDLKRVRETESRLAVFVEVRVGNLFYFKVGTTHGTWVPKGITDDQQRESMSRLAGIMRSQEYGFVMAGDFNAPREGEIYKTLISEANVADCVPRHITNSIDWKVRGKEGPDILVDYFFARAPYLVTDVEAHFGISDHAALSATVSRF